MKVDEFNKYKEEYSSLETSPERRNELITLMRGNLIKRNNNTSGIINCMDGKKYSIDSKNVEELYAIDAALRKEVNQKKMTEDSERARTGALEQNKYYCCPIKLFS